MAAVLRDAYGLPVSTDVPAAVAHYDRGVRALLAFDADPMACFRAALEADAEFALARAALAVSLYLWERIPEGRAEMERAARAAPGLPPRERRHVEALGLWVGGRGNEALPLIDEILAGTPREPVLIQRAYFIHFWQGRSAEMLALTARVLDAFPGDSYVLGMHAFALEETGRFREARAAAEQAIALEPRDAWAVHALAHVLYETGAHDEGVAALPPRIQPCDRLGPFRNHLLWHVALMHLAAGREAQAARMFERVFGRLRIEIGADLEDAVALAWRLDLFAHPEPARWAPLGAAARAWLDLPLLLFHDVHVGMALAAAGDWTAAGQQLDRMRQRAARTRNRTLPEVALPLLEGLHAFVRGELETTVERLAPIEDRIVEIGGSHAQREVFHDTLLAAALRAGDPARARRLLERRLARRAPVAYWTRVAAATPGGPVATRAAGPSA